MSKILDIAFTQYGIKEIPGTKDNPEVLKYFNILGFDGAKLKDETAWCSAFVNWVCIKAEKQFSKALNARSWLEVGYKVHSPQPGDIVVLWRVDPNSWQGHVGFYINHDDGFIWMFGGNQKNCVCISHYDINRVLEYRRL